MRSHGRKHVFVVCGNPDCHRNAELDVSRLPDDVTFNGPQPRMLPEYDSSKETLRTANAEETNEDSARKIYCQEY
jgi:hypothetical protein